MIVIVAIRSRSSRQNGRTAALPPLPLRLAPGSRPHPREPMDPKKEAATMFKLMDLDGNGVSVALLPPVSCAALLPGCRFAQTATGIITHRPSIQWSSRRGCRTSDSGTPKLRRCSCKWTKTPTGSSRRRSSCRASPSIRSWSIGHSPRWRLRRRWWAAAATLSGTQRCSTSRIPTSWTTSRK